MSTLDRQKGMELNITETGSMATIGNVLGGNFGLGIVRYQTVYEKYFQDYLTEKGLTCTRFSFADSNDVASVTSKAATDSDVIYIPTDNTAANCIETIANIILDKNVPVVAGEAGICRVSGVVTLSISYYDLGWKTGEMAADILTGAADVSEMPIAYAEATKQFNADVAQQLGLSIPEDYEALA